MSNYQEMMTFEFLEKVVNFYIYKKIFIVTGKQSFYKTGAKEIIDKIIPKKKAVFFNEFTSNPKIEEILRGVNLFRKEKCDLVIAIGGGSVIDTAKLINVISAQNISTEKFDILNFNIKKEGKCLIAIPTTSGTGSEATQFATVYHNKSKHSIESCAMLPSYIILYSPFTHGLPKDITAITALDALCQSLESYWSVNSTKKSLRYAKKSIKLALNVIQPVVNSPNVRNRKKMMQASYFSGKAINISKTTLCHAISYPITSFYDIPHGQAVALTIAKVLEYNNNITEADCNDKRGVNFVKQKIQEINEMFSCKSTDETILKIKEIINNIGVICDFKFLNIENIELIANECLKSNRTNNNPRNIDRPGLISLLTNKT